jgi:bisphosphoglycerate-dependent phosphoglycerate mutase
LTLLGKMEARTAGQLFYKNGIEVDKAFRYVLIQASFSCNMVLNDAHQHWVPVTKTLLVTKIELKPVLVTSTSTIYSFGSGP